MDFLAPSLAADEPLRRWYARFQRGACSPAVMAENIARLFQLDGRRVLPEVRCPTLVLHREDYAAIGLEHARYLAHHIPGAGLKILPGGDAPIYTQGMQETVDLIGRFLGRSPVAPADSRLFLTVLFTDIVASTVRAVELGDQRWRALLDAHDVAPRDAVAIHCRRVIKSTGDGILAAFDAPSRALRCATAIRDGVTELGIDVRAGLHAGQVFVHDDGDLSGVAVHVAARVMSMAGSGEVLASRSVVDLVTDVPFDDHGEHVLKGLPGMQQIFAVPV